MKKIKISLISFLLVVLTVSATAGIGQIEFDIEDIQADELEQCADAYDHERDGTADGDGEIGCTYPLWNAQYEGNTWDTGVKEITTAQQIHDGATADLDQFTEDFHETFSDNGPDNEGWELSNMYASDNCGSEEGPEAMYGGDGGTRAATTPEFSASGQIEINFALGISGGSTSSSSDCEYVDSGEGIEFYVSEDGGSSWELISYYESPGDGSSTYSTSSGGSLTGDYVSETVDVSSDELRFRWEQRSHSGSTYDHWGIDDITLTGGDYNYADLPENTHLVYPSISLRGNEFRIRDSESEEMSNLPHGIRFYDENINQQTNEFWESGEGNQNITKPEEINSEQQAYASANLTYNDEDITVLPYTYVQEVEYNDNVEETATNFDRATDQVPSGTTIQKPLRRPLAQEVQEDSEKTIETSTLIYPPHHIEGHYPDPGHEAYEIVRRGNGFKDNIEDEEDNYKIDNYELGNEVEGTETSPDEHHAETIEWNVDYGRPLEKHGMDSDHVDSPLNQEDYRCVDDNAGSCTYTSNCSGDSCDADSCTPYEDDDDADWECGSASCSYDPDLKNEIGNYYYETYDDVIERTDCEGEGTSTSSGSTSYGKKCTNTSTGSTCTAGTDRGWSDYTYNCHEEHSRVDGGSQGIGNNPTATFTQFTSHEDEEWTPDNYVNEDYNEGGSAWCGWDPSRTLTVNADGPNGRGNGWIVIDQNEGTGTDRVVARQGPLGDNKVGRNVHYRHGEHIENYGSDRGLERHDTDFIGSAFQGDIECPGSKEICAKYVNFRTMESGWEWAGSIENTIDFAIDGDNAIVHSYTADMSYGACKLINRVYNQDPDNNENAEIITCDYKTTTDEREHTSGPDGMGENAISVSPLPEACGDDPDEHLFTMAGPEIDHDRMVGNGYNHGYLNHHQKCVEIGQDQTENELRGTTQVDENSCLNKGNMYQEGTVKPVRRHRPDLDYDEFDDDDLKGDSDEWDLERDYDTTAQSPRNLDHNGDPARGPPVYEAQGDDLQESPDWEVCLNIDAEQEDFGDNAETTGKDRGSETEDIGGQWYDLDDPRVSEYVRENEELINDGDRFDRNDIAYYWRKNHNPQHTDWNPEGGNEGTAVDINCGNPNHPQISEYECSEAENQDDIDYDIPRIYNFLRESAGFNQDEFDQEVMP